jgi:hypothetical protein
MIVKAVIILVTMEVEIALTKTEEEAITTMAKAVVIPVAPVYLHLQQTITP